MSHVFDALARAAKDKEEAADKGQDSQWSWGRPSAETPQVGPMSAAQLESLAVGLREVESWPKSWKEKLEELLYGWGLGRYKSYPLVALEKNSAVAEQYKILREQLKRLRSETGSRCLSVTSPVKRDGKTMVAANLAAALALDYEEQVLLIDGDLRSPELHRYFGVDSTPGLADYLSGRANGDLMGYVRETSVRGLRILPAGRESSFSAELLAREKMRSLMEEVRSRFPAYQIIVDSPPVLATSDPLVLGRYVEGIIIVVRAGRTPREYLLKSIQSINSTKVVGIILNGLDPGLGSKYYYYYKKKS
jgi:protein-tyrosine kinase